MAILQVIDEFSISASKVKHTILMIDPLAEETMDENMPYFHAVFFKTRKAQFVDLLQFFFHFSLR